ncbi:unnamed protein product, partial [Oppiella nova]
MNKLLAKSLPAICVVVQLLSMVLFAFSFFNAEEVVFTTSHANGMDSTANSKAADFVRREDKYKAIDGYCARRV